MSKELKGIGQPQDEDAVWRYMSFEKFANMLATESLFFTRADRYEDKFEGYIPKSTTLPHKPEVNPTVDRVDQIFVNTSCVTVGITEKKNQWGCGTNTTYATAG